MGSPFDAEITPARLDELIRWHGTDESNLPPAHTLRNLSRDTVAALRELQRSRVAVARLRAAMARAFWATDPRELHAILLGALGRPPEETSVGPGDQPGGGPPAPAETDACECKASWTASRSRRRGD